jgi:hypothetical protein
VDFIRRWSEKTTIGAGRFIVWLDITASKFYDWLERYGKVNEHNSWVPRYPSTDALYYDGLLLQHIADRLNDELRLLQLDIV